MVLLTVGGNKEKPRPDGEISGRIDPLEIPPHIGPNPGGGSRWVGVSAAAPTAEHQEQHTAGRTLVPRERAAGTEDTAP